jgi:hypothetical protein
MDSWPDFPGGKGESEHFGRPTNAYLQKDLKNEALKSIGLEPLSTMDLLDTARARKVIEEANQDSGILTVV